MLQRMEALGMRRTGFLCSGVAAGSRTSKGAADLRRQNVKEKR